MKRRDKHQPAQDPIIGMAAERIGCALMAIDGNECHAANAPFIILPPPGTPGRCLRPPPDRPASQ